MDKFGRPLCREHQESERRNQQGSFQFEKKTVKIIEPYETKSEAIIHSDGLVEFNRSD